MLLSFNERRPSVPEGWRIVDLAEVVSDAGDGGTPSRNYPGNFGGNIPWVVITDIRPEIRETAERLTTRGLESSNAKLWPAGSVIVSTGATIGDVGVAAVDVATKQGITGLVPCQQQVISKYLAAVLRSSTATLERFAQGSTFKEIRPPTLLRLELRLPPLPEQCRLAEIFDALDDAIRVTEQIIAEGQQMKQGLLHDLLTRGIDENGELRDPERHPHQFKDTEFGALPVAWRVLSLGQLAVVRPSNVDKKALAAERKVFLCNYMDVYSNEVIHERLDFMEATASSTEIAKFALAANDVLITKDSETPDDIAVSAVVEGPLSKTVLCGYHLALLRPKHDVVDGTFLSMALRYRRVNDQFRLSANGSTRYGLTTAAIEGADIPVPSVEEQSRIVERYEALSRQISTEQEACHKLQVLKRGLMEDLLTGRVRVPVASEVAAS